MEVTLDVLDGMTIGGASGAGMSAYADKLWLAFVIAAGAVCLQLIKRGLTSTLARSLPTNPINTTEHTSVTTPEPIITPENNK